jgi:hypothetical protein
MLLSALIGEGHFTSYYDGDRHVYDLRCFRFIPHAKHYLIGQNVTEEWVRELLTLVIDTALYARLPAEELKKLHSNLRLPSEVDESVVQDAGYLALCAQMIGRVVPLSVFL